LDEFNCQELMEFKQVYACNNPLTHIQRKHFAFRKSVEFHLKIPLDLVQAGKQYYIHKFHWPIVLVRKRLATTSLLNAKCIKSIEDQQRLLYGITNEALRECRNKYGNLARDVLAGLTLSRDEILDLHLQVQAPVASRNDVIAYIQSVSSERSQRHNIRSRDEGSVPTSESVVVKQHIIKEAPPCPHITPGSPLYAVREMVDDQPLCATTSSPASPLAPRTLLPTTPQSEIVTTPATIVKRLQQTFQNHLFRGHVCEEFMQRKDVENAWKSLFRVHGLEDPIPLAFDCTDESSDQRPTHWLFFCKCGSWAEIGQALKKDERICSKCRNDKRKEGLRRIQIEKKSQELAHPSSRARFSSLATPVKVERYKNMRNVVKAEKRRNACLEEFLSEKHAKTLDSSDDKATELVSVASRFFSDNSDEMVNLIMNIVMTKSGSSNKSESNVRNFAEHCVNAIKNFTKVVNGQEKQVRFTPLTLRAALSLWMRCKKGYAVHRALSVDIMPSESRLKGILKGNRVNEGKCAMLYGWFYDNHVSKCDGCINAHLMHDELKLVNDVY
jgi:hypothetical protein